jgi:drug/metabolite transporter (DMT)-like permease
MSAFGEFSQAWTRALILLIVIFLINFRFHIFRPLQRSDLPWLVFIALCGGLNQAPYFYGFQHLSIGTATLLFYAALVVGGYLLGRIFFAEKMTFIKILSLLIAFAGMFTIYGFQLHPSQILPASLTVLAGLMGSVTVIIPKKLTGDYPEFQIMVGYFSLGVLFNGLLCFLLHDPLPALSQTTTWLAQLGYAAAMILANWAAIEGYRHFDTSIGSLIGLAEIIFGIAFGIIFFHEPLTGSILAGATLIILSAALPNLPSKYLKVSKNSPANNP